MIHEIENVCFCLARRHPNVFIGRRLPSNCRYCNAQFDLNSIMSKAEAEAKGLLKMPEEAAPKAPAEEPAAPPAAIPTGFGMGRPSVPVSAPPVRPGFGASAPAAPVSPVPAGFGMGKPPAPIPPSPVPPPAPVGFGAAPVPPSSAPAGFGMGRPSSPVPPPTPVGFGAQSPASFVGFSAAFAPKTTPAAQAYQFDFFGEKISVPQEGGWLGRSAIGSEWFKGNLLISREHVKVVPMPDGRLQVGPDKSLNGVSITANGAKRALGRNETAVLSAGDTLWLYNVPLQLEMK